LDGIFFVIKFDRGGVCLVAAVDLDASGVWCLGFGMGFLWGLLGYMVVSVCVLVGLMFGVVGGGLG